ncbi:MAG: T9SS type A sorting domain-containing protein, partial [Sphingobacteriales bacterium]
DITSVELTSSPDIVYIAHTTASSASSIRLRKTVDNGKTWTLIKGLPTIPLFLSDIGADPKDPGHLFITISGYSEKYKVYESKDTGATWKNVTENLPNVPINCVQIEGSMEEGVYIGTDLGVFYRNSESAEWKFFNDDLPLVMVNELEILPQFNKVRAATYGRGAWEAPLSGTLTSINRMKHIAKDIMLYPNPSATYTTLKLPETGVALNEIRIYDMSGKCLQTIKSNPLETQITLDIKHFSPGIYMVNLLMAEGTVTKKLNVVR